MFRIKFLTKNLLDAYLPPPSGAVRLQRLPCLKYYSVLKGESRFTLGLNAA